MSGVPGKVRDRPDRLKRETHDVNNGQDDDRLVAPQVRVGDYAAHQRKEVSEHGEGVVDGGGGVVVPAKVVAQVQQENGWRKKKLLECRELCL